MPKVKEHDETFSVKGKKLPVEQDPIALRVGGRTKKAKIVFDPSVNNMPKKRQMRSYSSCSEKVYYEKPAEIIKQKRPRLLRQVTPEYLPEKRLSKQGEPSTAPERDQLDDCYVCGKIDNRKNRKLIACKECGCKVHADCLKIKTQNQALLETAWRCNNCITCSVCYETSESGNIVTCCICVESYHIKCITPKSLQKNINRLKWECIKCRDMNAVKEDANICDEGETCEENGGHTSPTSNKPFISLEIKKGPGVNNQPIIIKKESFSSSQSESSNPTSLDTDTFKNWIKLEEDIPDVKKWNCDEVTTYISKYFPLEAVLFKEQQIDGPCLMLMKRSDVMHLPIKLGPAIRLYSLITRIQTRSNDPRLTWM